MKFFVRFCLSFNYVLFSPLFLNGSVFTSYRNVSTLTVVDIAQPRLATAYDAAKITWDGRTTTPDALVVTKQMLKHIKHFVLRKVFFVVIKAESMKIKRYLLVNLEHLSWRENSLPENGLYGEFNRIFKRLERKRF